MTRACMVLLLIWLVSRGGETLANSSQDEISDNTVEVTFYLVSSSQWSQSADFQQVLSTQATTYCQGELKECGLVEQVQFQPGNINISDGYPREENRNLVLQFCILYPSGARLLNNSVTKQVLPRSVTYAVSGLADTRESFYKKTSYSLIKITAGNDVKEQTPYPNTEMNIIMSIVGVLVLIIVCAIAIGCHCYRQQKDRKARIAKMSKNMKSKQYNNQLNDNKVSPLGTDDIPWEHNRSRDNLRGTEAKVYKEKETKSSRSLSKTVGKPNNALPPVETGVGSEKKKKKKRKKEKERRKDKDKLVREGKKAHRSQQGVGYENETFDLNETLNSTSPPPPPPPPSTDFNQTSESLNGTKQNGNQDFHHAGENAVLADVNGVPHSGYPAGGEDMAFMDNADPSSGKTSSEASDKHDLAGTGTTSLTYVSDEDHVTRSHDGELANGAPETQTTEL